MKITLPPQIQDAVKEIKTKRISRRGAATDFQDCLVVEHMLELYINDVFHCEIVCSPTNLEDLVLGRLLTEGVIQSTEDVELLSISEAGMRANVFLGEETVPMDKLTPVRMASCGTGNRVCSDQAAQDRSPKRLQPIPFETEWIYRLAREMKSDMPLYAATHGTHSALLMRQGEILSRAEDISRHNALDKVIGWALRQRVPLGECIAYTSGRIPVDMVWKAIRAGIPIFVGKAMPTQQSVELARQWGLTLIAGSRADSMILFPEEDGQ